MLFYDERDQKIQEERGLETLYWLDDLGAVPITDARPESTGFLFAGARSLVDYTQLLSDFPQLRDRPEERRPLLDLELALQQIESAAVQIPQAQTWVLRLDHAIPPDISYPLFLRTGKSSWKLGGKISKVNNQSELESESAELRRAFGWNANILARQWLHFDVAGDSLYGPIPQEARVWIVDGTPHAWSFHHMQVVPDPLGFPLSRAAERSLFELAAKVGQVFGSRLVVADFAPCSGDWYMVEVGLGSAAGTGHEAVFKSVANLLGGGHRQTVRDKLGATFAI